jgi:hypothetical protein
MKTPVKRRAKPRSTTAQSGYWSAKAALVRFGSHAFDGRTRIAKALDEFRDALVADLGGPEAISKQQEIIITLATRTHFLVESLDAYIFSMKSPVNKQRRCLYPVIRERQSLADSLAKHLAMLGLEKKLPPAKPLHEYISEPPVGDETDAEDDPGHDERPEAVSSDVSASPSPQG